MQLDNIAQLCSITQYVESPEGFLSILATIVVSLYAFLNEHNAKA
jgi:hypothetical protein